MKTLFRSAALALVLGLAALPAKAGETLVAVAVNFTATANEIADAFTKATGHTVKYSFGSTGQIYTQITQGAPYEVFLAADGERSAQAEAEGHAVPGTRFTYAVGKLVLWAKNPAFIDESGQNLTSPSISRIAITNPVTAPYGAAAVEVLKKLGIHDAVTPKLVQGNNLAQTQQYVMTENAQVGFVSLAQMADTKDGAYWRIPQEMYTPLNQDAVLLKKGEANPAARAFLDFLQGPEARAIIERYGFEIVQ